MFEKDDPVWVRKQPTPGANPKLECKWEPGSIVERITVATYKVHRPDRAHKKLATLNVNQLKPRTLEVIQPKQGPMTRSRARHQQAIISLIRDSLSYDEIVMLLRKGYDLVGNAIPRIQKIPDINVQPSSEPPSEDEDEFFEARSQPPTPPASKPKKIKVPKELKRLASFLQSGLKDLVPSPSTSRRSLRIKTSKIRKFHK